LLFRNVNFDILLTVRLGPYRVTVLLNASIKVMAHIIANRLDLWLPSIITKSQHCAVRGDTILDAFATVLETIAQAEHTKQALCILSLTFRPLSITSPTNTYFRY
jgi:hypothetical protein